VLPRLQVMQDAEEAMLTYFLEAPKPRTPQRLEATT